jgi:hypothetical protein
VLTIDNEGKIAATIESDEKTRTYKFALTIDNEREESGND